MEVTAFRMPPKTWECPDCDTVNRPSARTCMVCAGSRSARSTEPEPPPAHPHVTVPQIVPGTTAPAPRKRSPGRKNRVVTRTAVFVLGTGLIPFGIGHYAWRPRFAPSYRVPDPRVLPQAVYWLPEYVFGAGAILAVVFLALILPPRPRSGLGSTLALLAAAAGLGLAGTAHNRLQSLAQDRYVHAGIRESAVASNCRRPLVRWSTGAPDGTYVWTATRSRNCAKTVVYRGWVAHWSEDAHKGTRVLAVAHFTGLIAELTGTSSGRPDMLLVRTDVTGKQAWSYRCPAGYGRLRGAGFAGAAGGSSAAPEVKGRREYVMAQCGEHAVYLDAKAKKKVFARH